VQRESARRLEESERSLSNEPAQRLALSKCA
jgi:hypothetical protein